MASLAAPRPYENCPAARGGEKAVGAGGEGVGAIAVTGVTSLQVRPLVSTLVPEGGGQVAIPENVGTPP